MPWVDNCCRCCTLKTGTIVAGALGIVIAFATMLVVLLTKIKIQTIVLGNLDTTTVKIIIMINLGMTVLISVLLIVGAVKRSRTMMLPWVVLAIIIAIGLVISVIYTAVVEIVDNNAISRYILLVTGLVGSAVFIYLWVVVFSFFQLVKEEKSRGPYGRPPYIYKT